MRRSMVDPSRGIQSHRFMNYDGKHPFEKISRNLAREREMEGDESDFKPLRIHFELSYLDDWNVRYYSVVQHLKSKVLPATSKFWSSALNVVPISGPLIIERKWCPYGNPSSPAFNEGIMNADVVVYVTANSEICDGGETLASAFSCYWDQFDRPVAGNIDFCLENMNLDNIEDDSSSFEQAIATATHEFGHLLGVSSVDFVFFYDWSTGDRRTLVPKKESVICVDGSTQTVFVPSTNTLKVGGMKNGLPVYEVVTPTVKSVVRNQFNCFEMDGARLENQRTFGDCFGSHWDERFFFTELMSSIQTDVTEYLSSLTLGLLYDSGWYKPNFELAKISPFGYGAGCDFVQNDCIVKGNVPNWSQGFFCNNLYQPEKNLVYGCDPTHMKMAVCDLVNLSSIPNAVPPPLDFQYFNDSNFGSLMQTSDFCPTFSSLAISCQYNKTSKTDYEFEKYGQFSRCYETDGLRPVCLETFCEPDHSVVVRVDSENITCEYDGQAHFLPNFNTSILCPRLAVICPELYCPQNCAGKGKCDFVTKTCKCVDETDFTLGCTNSIHIIPPKLVGASSNIVLDPLIIIISMVIGISYGAHLL